MNFFKFFGAIGRGTENILNEKKEVSRAVGKKIFPGVSCIYAVYNIPENPYLSVNLKKNIGK